MVADGFRLLNGDCVLCQRLDDGNNVDFLNSHLPDAGMDTLGRNDAVVTLDLTGDEETGDRVEPSTGEARDGVGGARSSSDHADAKVLCSL